MRGLLQDRGWVEIETDPQAYFWTGKTHYSIKGDPEAGLFVAEEFEEIES